MKLFNILILLIIVSVSTNGYAEITEPPKENLSAEQPKEIKNTDIPKENNGTATMLLIGEALFALNAGMAALSPKAYGIVGAIVFPIGAANGSATSETTRWVGLAAAESIAVYNLTINENRKSKGEIFVENMIAWHIFTGIVFLTNSLTSDLKKSTNASLDYVPVKNGGGLMLSKRF
jgi:hypothetical protein